MTTSVDVKVDASAVQAALDQLDDRNANAAIGRAAKKGATFLAQKARPEAPVGKKSKPAKQRLRRTISARGAKRDKPGAVVVVRAKHRHLVIRGTAERFTKAAPAAG